MYANDVMEINVNYVSYSCNRINTQHSKTTAGLDHPFAYDAQMLSAAVSL